MIFWNFIIWLKNIYNKDNSFAKVLNKTQLDSINFIIILIYKKKDENDQFKK